MQFRSLDNEEAMKDTLASSITKAASSQTYYTIRFLADRERVEDAYRAYAYFRWVDDILDADSGAAPARLAFLERQKSLLERCYQGRVPDDLNLQESILFELVRHDQDMNSGLQLYLSNMMQVMEFDVKRRGMLISESGLKEYTHCLATAVMEAIHYFIGHDEYSPHDETRYLAVAAAHITHMLRDTYDDIRLGYYNVPREVLETYHIGPQDTKHPAYRDWVKGRISLARQYFRAGKGYFSRVQSARCRLACYAYIARFEWLLDTIEQEGYCLRPQYRERKSTRTGLLMSWLTLSCLLNLRGAGRLSQMEPPAAANLNK
jgi:phytoene/squalene synthetase